MRAASRVDRTARGDPFGERAALDQLHDDVRAFVVLDHVVHDDDVRVPQLCDGTGLAQGPVALLSGLVRGECGVEGDLLDRDLAAEQLVGRTPDDAHAAPPDPGLQPVTAGDHPDVVPLGPHASHHAAMEPGPPGGRPAVAVTGRAAVRRFPCPASLFGRGAPALQYRVELLARGGPVRRRR